MRLLFLCQMREDVLTYMAIGKSCRCCEISRIVWQRCKVQNEADAVPLASEASEKNFCDLGGVTLIWGGGGSPVTSPKKIWGVTVTSPKNIWGGGVTGDPPHRKSFCRTKVKIHALHVSGIKCIETRQQS